MRSITVFLISFSLAIILLAEATQENNMQPGPANMPKGKFPEEALKHRGNFPESANKPHGGIPEAANKPRGKIPEAVNKQHGNFPHVKRVERKQGPGKKLD